ncbi:MAG TPA: hypothetical protein DCG51_06625 [Erysipelotrichaceae bacterium]|nr:hypothetical protein [Erysipelotrichaceae bacterium]
MALNDKLKENIANGTVPEPEIPYFSAKPKLHSQSSDIDQVFSELDESLRETSEAVDNYEAEPVEPVKQAPEEPKPEMPADLQNRLSELEQNMSGFTESFNKQAALNYSGIVKSINDAKDSLVSKFESGQGTAFEERLKALENAIGVIGDKQDRNDRQIAQTLRENANFQIQVRQGMQKDLEELREQLNGEQFTPLLKMISQIYVEYQVLFEDKGMEERTRKNLTSLFSDLEEILEEYDAEVVVSQEGTIRKPRATKIIEKIATGDPQKHNTVARSRKPGVVKGKMILYPEFVDVYVYDESLAVQEEKNDEDEIILDETVNPEAPADDVQEKELIENEDSINEENDQSDQEKIEGEEAGGE